MPTKIKHSKVWTQLATPPCNSRLIKALIRVSPRIQLETQPWIKRVMLQGMLLGCRARICVKIRQRMDKISSPSTTCHMMSQLACHQPIHSRSKKRSTIPMSTSRCLSRPIPPLRILSRCSCSRVKARELEWKRQFLAKGPQIGNCTKDWTRIKIRQMARSSTIYL